MTNSFAAGAFCLLVCASSARASVVVSFQEIGGKVTGTLVGSLNLTGMTKTPGFASGGGGIAPVFATFGTGVNASLQDGYFDQVSGPSAFGSGVGISASAASGDAVFLTGAQSDLFLPIDYVSGAPLSATLLFTGASLNSLGAAVGDYVYTLRSGDTLTVRIGATVPEPGSLALVASAITLLGLSTRRKWHLFGNSPALRF